jgi:hypothetical protein
MVRVIVSRDLLIYVHLGVLSFNILRQSLVSVMVANMHLLHRPDEKNEGRGGVYCYVDVKTFVIQCVKEIWIYVFNFLK